MGEGNNRNKDCPCGSGKKLKKCCGKRLNYQKVQEINEKSIEKNFLLKKSVIQNLPAEKDLHCKNTKKIQFGDLTSDDVKELKVRSKNGETEAIICLGLAYIEGEIINKDEKKGLDTLIKAYKLGNERAIEAAIAVWEDKTIKDDKILFELAKWLYEYHFKIGKPGDKFVFEIRKLELICSLECAFGIFYMEGRGVEKNYIDAHKWLRKAAFNDHPDAMFTIGMAYRYGRGVEQCHQTALNYWISAAELDHEKSIEYLAAYSILDENFDDFDVAFEVSEQLKEKIDSARKSMLENQHHPINLILYVVDNFNNNIDQAIKSLREFMTFLDGMWVDCVEGMYFEDENLSKLIQISLHMKSIIIKRGIIFDDKSEFIHYTRADVFNIIFNKNGNVAPFRLWDITKCDKDSVGYDPEEGEVIYNDFGIDRPDDYDIIPLATCFCSNEQEKSEMWKYADKHKGVALRFNGLEINKEYPIDYDQVCHLANEKGEKISLKIINKDEYGGQFIIGPLKMVEGKRLSEVVTANQNSPFGELRSMKHWKSSDISEIYKNIPLDHHIKEIHFLNENGEEEKFTRIPDEKFIDKSKRTPLPVNVIYIDEGWEKNTDLVYEQMKDIKDIILSLPEEYQKQASKLIIELSHIVKRSKYADEEEVRLLYFTNQDNVKSGDVQYCENTNRHYLETPIMKPCEVIVGAKVSDEDFAKIKSTADACGIENIRKSDISPPNLI